MAKLDNPLLSFGAHGSIGNALTFQKRNRGTMARKKPTPTDPYSLPQAYQRWLYQDYAEYWHSLTAAQKQQWETDARRQRITGFNYWMSTHLKTLPDIAAMWRLDERSGNTAIDFSPNANHATIFGASHVPGIIDYALSFDGLDDYLMIGKPASLDITTDITIDFFLKVDALPVTHVYITKDALGATRQLYLGSSNGKMIYYLNINGVWTGFIPAVPWLSLDTWHYVCAQYDGSTMTLIVDDNIQTLAAPGAITIKDADWRLASTDKPADPRFTRCIFDHLAIYTRILNATTRQAHSERRYPV